MPWDDIIGMRVIPHHRYHAIDYETLWNVLETNIPNLVARLREVLDRPE